MAPADRTLRTASFAPAADTIGGVALARFLAVVTASFNAKAGWTGLPLAAAPASSPSTPKLPRKNCNSNGRVADTTAALRFTLTLGEARFSRRVTSMSDNTATTRSTARRAARHAAEASTYDTFGGSAAARSAADDGSCTVTEALSSMGPAYADATTKLRVTAAPAAFNADTRRSEAVLLLSLPPLTCGTALRDFLDTSARSRTARRT